MLDVISISVITCTISSLVRMVPIGAAGYDGAQIGRLPSGSSTMATLPQIPASGCRASFPAALTTAGSSSAASGFRRPSGCRCAMVSCSTNCGIGELSILERC